MGPQLLGAFCEMAWNQGIDLYGHSGKHKRATMDGKRRRFRADLQRDVGTNQWTVEATDTEAFGAWGRRTSAAYSIRYDRQTDGSLVYRITEMPSPDGPAGKSWPTTGSEKIGRLNTRLRKDSGQPNG